MTSHESELTPEPTPSDTVPTPTPALDAGLTSSDEPKTRRPGTAWIWLVTLTAGLAAGFGSWLLAEPIYGRYQPERKSTSAFATPEETAAADLAQRQAMVMEATLTFGTLGAFLGLTLGLAGGLVRGSIRAGLTAAAIGLVVGAVGGLLAGWFITPLHYTLVLSIGDDLPTAILIQGGICAWSALWRERRSASVSVKTAVASIFGSSRGAC